MLQNKNGNSKFKDLIKQNLKQLILANRLAFRGKQQDRDIGCEQNIYRYTQRKTIYFIMKLLDRWIDCMHYCNRFYGDNQRQDFSNKVFNFLDMRTSA